MDLRYLSLQGKAIAEYLEPLAALRLQVFRDWPYLYDGTLDYERHYLETYVRCAESLTVLVFDGERCVGATTALPLSAAHSEVHVPFLQLGLPIAPVLYFGESVVLGSHRGRGIGIRFFELREAHAQTLGLAQCAFCAVDRPAAHPLKPPAHVPNDGFWTRRGYTRHPELVCSFDWQDLGEQVVSAHTLTYWLRTL